MVPCSLMATLSEPPDRGVNLKEELLLIESSHEVSIESLPLEEKQVYHQLGPLYQKIYLYALNDEERHRVVVYVRRGLSSFEAINTILRAEERQYLQKNVPKTKQPIAPSNRSSKGSCSSTTIY